MELLDRYLQAVSFFLPRRAQTDIIRELSENLISQFEDREEELGRNLTEDEQAEILRRHGHPMQVAAGYYSRRHLIGPTFFPIYVLSLKIGIAAAFLLGLLIAILNVTQTESLVAHFARVLWSFPGRALTVFAWTTLVFAGLDLMHSYSKVACNWDPRKLPKAVQPEDRISRSHAAWELAFTLLYVTWLLLLPLNPQFLFGQIASVVDPAPVWRLIYLPMVLMGFATAALAITDLVRPWWTPKRSIVRIGVRVASLVILSVLLSAGEWAVAKPSAELPGGAGQVLLAVNTGLAIGLRVAVVVTVIDIGRELWRMISRRKLSANRASRENYMHEGHIR